MSSTLPLQILTRDSTGVFLSTGPATSDATTHGEPVRLCDACELTQYSPNGRYLAVVNAENVTIYESATAAVVSVVPAVNVSALHFSPSGTWLVTWHRRRDEEDRNLLVWTVTTGEQVAGFIQKAFNRDTWPTIQFSGDERMAVKASGDSINVYAADKLGEPPIISGRCDHVAHIALSPGPLPVSIAAFSPEAKGSPAILSLFALPDLSSPVARKTFFRSNRAEFYWSPKGTSVILHAVNDVSATNYYGDSHLYLMTTDGRVSKQIILPKEGPIHAVAWSPSGRDVVVIGGSSPPVAVMLNAVGEPVFEFGVNHRNSVFWAPHGRFLCLAGFGNMSGGMDFWDRNKLKIIGSTKSDYAITSGWSPDSRWFITACVHPRMRVSNGYRIFKYNGSGPVIDHSRDVLLEASFRPSMPEMYPDRPASPGAVGPGLEAATGGSDGVSVPAKPAPWRPRHATSGASSISAMMEAGRSTGAKKIAPPPLPTGGRPAPRGKPALLTPAGVASGQKAVQAAAALDRLLPPKSTAVSEAEAAASAVQAAIKKQKAIQKKLKEIGALKAVPEKSRDHFQKVKIDSEPALLAELAEIERTIGAAGALEPK